MCPPSGQQREQRLGEEERPAEVNGEETVEVGLGHRGDGVVGAEAGVVEEAVEGRAVPHARELLADGVAKRGERLAPGDVERKSDRLAALVLRWRGRRRRRRPRSGCR